MKTPRKRAPTSRVPSRKAPARQSRRLPFVLVNVAMTADGKIATANRSISSFSSRRDQDHLMELRATADAVMAGARTVDLNPVTLGPGPAKYRRARLKRGLAEFNVRIIVSRSGSIDPQAKIFERDAPPGAGPHPKGAILVLTSRRAPASKLRQLRSLADEVRVWDADEIDFREALQWLRERWGVKRLLCEGGGELNDALFRGGLVNELHLTICPKIFGGRNAPTIADGLGAACLGDARQLERVSQKRIGDELFLVFKCTGRKPDVQRRAAAR